MPTSLAYGKTLASLDVVLVHDNRGAQAILRSMVSSMHIARLRVYDYAEQALSDMMVDPPTVLIAEWEMKPMSGYRLVRTIREKDMEPLSFMPILAVTPMPTLSMVDRAFSIGVNNIVVMPVSPVALRHRFEWLLRDDREFVLQDNHYVLGGMEEVLEERIRRADIGNLLRKQKAMQDAIAKRAENAQDVVDRIVNGEVGEHDPTHGGQADQSKVTWNSWNVT
ncbi:response regulator [Microbaculum sp. FT89]|uniref:response regulator n=1 Tax=Microbaculum sp. FT89 TaxID=3447298 RepID=UPI003F52B93B